MSKEIVESEFYNYKQEGLYCCNHGIGEYEAYIDSKNAFVNS